MYCKPITEHLNFRIGDQVMWLERSLNGEITEMVCSPEGPVFWLSSAPYWVKPSEVVPVAAGVISASAMGIVPSPRFAWVNINQPSLDAHFLISLSLERQCQVLSR